MNTGNASRVDALKLTDRGAAGLMEDYDQLARDLARELDEAIDHIFRVAHAALRERLKTLRKGDYEVVASTIVAYAEELAEKGYSWHPEAVSTVVYKAPAEPHSSTQKTKKIKQGGKAK